MSRTSPPKPWERSGAGGSSSTGGNPLANSTTNAGSSLTTASETSSTPTLPPRDSTISSYRSSNSMTSPYGNRGGDYGYGSSGYDRYGSNSSYGSGYGSGYGSMGGYGGSSYGSSYGGSSYGSGYGMGGYGTSSYGTSGYGSSRYGSGYGGYGSSYGSSYGGSGYGMGGYGSSSYGSGYGMGGYGSSGYDRYEPPGRFGSAMSGPSNWMSDFHAVTEGFARFSSLLDANFQAVHGSFFSVINLIERVSHLYREIGFAISGIAVFKIVWSVFRKLINVFRKLTGRQTEEDQLAQAGFDMKSFKAFENPAGGPMEQQPQQRASAVGTLIALLGLSFVTIPVAVYAINKAISFFKKSDPSQAATGPVKPFFVRALYDYDSPSPNDLRFRAGEIITVVAKPFEQWWEGEMEFPNGQRQTGLFPANLVEEIDEQALQLMLRNQQQQQLAQQSRSGNPYYGNQQQQYGPSMDHPNLPPYSQMQTGIRRPGSYVANIEEVDDFDAMNEDSNQHLVASATSNRSSTPFASQVPSNTNNTNASSNNNNNTNQRVNWANPARQAQGNNNVNSNVNNNTGGGLRRTTSVPVRNNNNNNVNSNSNVNNNNSFNGKSRPLAQTTTNNVNSTESTQ